jgi:molecular chaperone HscB
LNYFQLFGLSANFNIDLAKLSQLYQALQKTVHPDRFAHGSSQQQMIAVQKSAMINDAYQTLKKPLERAGYLLKLRGTEMPSEQASFSDNQFLMRQMDLREMLAEVKFADDVDSALFEANQTLEQEFLVLFKAMQTRLAQNTIDADKLAYEDFRKLKFYQKLQIELERLEEQLLTD